MNRDNDLRIVSSELRSEALEASQHDRLLAAANLLFQVLCTETFGVIGLYEEAARFLGVSSSACDRLIEHGRTSATAMTGTTARGRILGSLAIACQRYRAGSLSPEAFAQKILPEQHHLLLS